MENIEIIEDRIPTKVYQNLRVICGLSPKTDVACEIGLNNSVHSIMVKIEDEIVGMGRIIGDGGCFCQIVDICVSPSHQGKGIGKIIMKKLTDFIHNNLPESCYVSLIADGNASFLYEKFGFQDTMPESKGMYIRV